MSKNENLRIISSMGIYIGNMQNDEEDSKSGLIIQIGYHFTSFWPKKNVKSRDFLGIFENIPIFDSSLNGIIRIRIMLFLLVRDTVLSSSLKALWTGKAGLADFHAVLSREGSESGTRSSRLSAGVSGSRWNWLPKYFGDQHSFVTNFGDKNILVANSSWNRSPQLTAFSSKPPSLHLRGTGQHEGQSFPQLTAFSSESRSLCLSGIGQHESLQDLLSRSAML